MSLLKNLSKLISGSAASLSDGSTEVILGPILNEGKSSSAQVSKYATEDGGSVSDHVHLDPPQFSIEFFLVDKNDLMASAMSLFSGGDKTVSEKVQILDLWQGTGSLLTYSGPVFSGFFAKGYDMVVDNVVISSLSRTRTPDLGAGLKVSISLQKMVIAASRIETINLPQKIRPKKNKGQSATAEKKVEPKRGSALAKLQNKIEGLI